MKECESWGCALRRLLTELMERDPAHPSLEFRTGVGVAIMSVGKFREINSRASVVVLTPLAKPIFAAS